MCDYSWRHSSMRERTEAVGGASAGKHAGGRHVTTEEAPSSDASLCRNGQILAIKNAFWETTAHQPERVHECCARAGCFRAVVLQQPANDAFAPQQQSHIHPREAEHQPGNAPEARRQNQPASPTGRRNQASHTRPCTPTPGLRGRCGATMLSFTERVAY